MPIGSWDSGMLRPSLRPVRSQQPNAYALKSVGRGAYRTASYDGYRTLSRISWASLIDAVSHRA